MSDIHLSLAAARGAMKIMSDGAVNADFSSFGIGEKEFDLLVGPTPWLQADKNIVVRVMDALLFGTMDITGVPRFQPPAEYIAAVIAQFVSGTNAFTACRWMEGGSRAEELATGPLKEGDPVTCRQLLALVCLIEGSDAGVAAAFEKATGLAISRSKEEVPDGKVSKKA